MTSTRWAIAGLVAALVLFVVGGLLGYRLGTSSDAEHRIWREETRTLRDSLERAHREEMAAVREGVASDSAARVAAEREARRQTAASQASQAEADTLRAELAIAELAADSVAMLRIYPALVVKLDSAVSRETARGDALEEALAAEKRATARLTGMIGTQVAIIGQLQDQVSRIPKPKRRGIRLLGVDVAPCGYAGVGTRGTDAGVGLCVTP
jgi:hypothetical protein